MLYDNGYSKYHAGLGAIAGLVKGGSFLLCAYLVYQIMEPDETKVHDMLEF
jgi:hypothetical protein